MKNIVNTGAWHRGGEKPSNNATFVDLVKRFFESIKKKCCELSLVNSESTNNKQLNDNKIDSPLTIHKRQLTKFAFTLAETLVVMGIIGVVAALTIPNLNQSTGDREKVAKLKKVYSNLEDAFGRATAVYGPIDEWIQSDDALEMSTKYAERFIDFFKVSKNCETSGDDACLHGSNGYAFNLADGTSLEFYIKYANCDYNTGDDQLYSNDYCGEVMTDIDGSYRGKNKEGIDRFRFYVTKQGIVPYGTKNSKAGEDLKCLTEFVLCTAWVIDNGNMDYLKANKGVCPNGTTLSWENTSCK